MELQRVNFEQAKKLKELGFDWETREYWLDHTPKGPMEDWGGEEQNYNASYTWHYSRPTVALAIKWLREVEHISVDVGKVCITPHYSAMAMQIGGDNHRYYLFKEFIVADTHDLAESASLTKSLELLTDKI